jgi:hypothetical protein
MTSTPGDQPPQEPSNDPSHNPSAGPPGYWEQQAQQHPYAYPPQGFPPQAPVQYPPDHPRATTSLVLGILGIVACQVIAPFAWVIGKKTVDEIDAARGTIGGRSAAQAGYIMGVVGSVLLALSVAFFVLWLAFIAVVTLGGASSP